MGDPEKKGGTVFTQRCENPPWISCFQMPGPQGLGVPESPILRRPELPSPNFPGSLQVGQVARVIVSGVLPIIHS
jgi:hypothetical protein